MVYFRWFLILLWAPFLWGCSLPLVRPNRLDWNPTFTPQTAQIKGNAIFYVVKGEGKPLILIHGYGAGMWVWEKQIDFLSQYYRVYALDLVGHGFSDRPKVPYTPEAYIHFLRDFMDGVGIEKAILIGHSMGGGIAWSVAALFPERVEKLILINCVPPDVLHQVRNDSLRLLVAIQDIPLLPYLVVAGRTKRSIKWILQESVANPRLITPEILNRQYRLSKIKGTTWVLYSTFKNAKEASKLKDYLIQIDQPTLLIWGRRDLIFPPSIGEDLQQAIRGSKLQLIHGSGHIPMWETPEPVNEALLSFLK